MNWNLNNKEKYLNAVCASLRAFWEQIIFWTYISMTSEKSEQNKRMKLIDTFSKNRTTNLFNDIRDEINSEGEVNSTVIVDYLEFLGINKTSDNFGIYWNFLIDFIQKKAFIILFYARESIHYIEYIVIKII